jgi:hypothetical protein
MYYDGPKAGLDFNVPAVHVPILARPDGQQIHFVAVFHAPNRKMSRSVQPLLDKLSASKAIRKS